MMQAVPMSKQANRVNIEPEICMETGLPTGSIMKCNFLLTLSLLVKLTLFFVTIIIMQAIPIQCRSWLKK